MLGWSSGAVLASNWGLTWGPSRCGEAGFAGRIRDLPASRGTTSHPKSSPNCEVLDLVVAVERDLALDRVVHDRFDVNGIRRVPAHVVAVGIELLRLRFRVEHAEVRRRIGSTPGHPLPVV